MTAALCCIAALATLAQANPPVVAPGPEPADKIQVIAFQATREGQATRQVDAELRPLDALLKDMDYDTFRVVQAQEVDLPAQSETMVQINDTYALYILPLGKDEQGLLAMQARVTLMQGGKLVNALLTQGKAKPGRAMLFRGLNIPGGELGIVLRLVPPPPDPKDGDSDSQSNDDQQQQQQEQPQDPTSGGDDQQGDQNASDQSNPGEDQKDESSQKGMANEDKKEGEEEEGESAQAGQESEDTEGEQEGAQSGEPKDLEDIDALLKSLEDQDRREQKSTRNNRDSIRFNGDWW